WCLEMDTPARHRSDPVEDFDSCRNTHCHGRDCEKAVGARVHPDCEHVMRPHTHAHEGNTDRSCNHDGVSEDRLPRKYRYDLGHKSEARNNEDVHFRMSEYP